MKPTESYWITFDSTVAGLVDEVVVDDIESVRERCREIVKEPAYISGTIEVRRIHEIRPVPLQMVGLDEKS